MTYLTYELINSAIGDLWRNYGIPIFNLPNPTHEGRISLAFKIRPGGFELPDGVTLPPSHPFLPHPPSESIPPPPPDPEPRPGVLLVGGIQPNEWGSSDILIYFASILLDAYESNSDLNFGDMVIPANMVREIVDKLDIFIFPNVNPDGKAYSQSDILLENRRWRKNRRPLPGTADIGVNINQNFDWLWDNDKYLHINSLSWGSTNPSSRSYCGPYAFSEAETLNVKWMLDTFPNIRYFIDIHCTGEVILYPWGHDQTQYRNWDMNFLNPDYDGERGLKNDGYREFMFIQDAQRFEELATQMKNAIEAVRGKNYDFTHGFSRVAITRNSKDYAYSRHIIDSTKAKIFAFVLEWGTWSNDPNTGFGSQPDYAEMENIMDDVSSGLLSFCISATEPDIYIRDSIEDRGDLPVSYSSESPDIIIRQEPPTTIFVTNPELRARFDNPSDGDISVKIKRTKENLIYFRVYNRGASQANHSLEVYLSTPNNVGNPDQWEHLGNCRESHEPFSYIEPNSYKLRWTYLNPLPEPGQYYIIVLADTTDDPMPDKSRISNDIDFEGFVRYANNMACKIIRVIHSICFIATAAIDHL